jgi:hypothetical protein
VSAYASASAAWTSARAVQASTSGIRSRSNLPEVVARYGGAVLGPPLNRPNLRIER